jgi:hypothetical protein
MEATEARKAHFWGFQPADSCEKVVMWRSSDPWAAPGLAPAFLASRQPGIGRGRDQYL